jgi:hypothetical protein
VSGSRFLVINIHIDLHKNKKGQPQGLPLHASYVWATLVVILLELSIDLERLLANNK